MEVDFLGLAPPTRAPEVWYAAGRAHAGPRHHEDAAGLGDSPRDVGHALVGNSIDSGHL